MPPAAGWLFRSGSDSWYADGGLHVERYPVLASLRAAVHAAAGDVHPQQLLAAVIPHRALANVRAGVEE
jgi:hypothetical protein